MRFTTRKTNPGPLTTLTATGRRCCAVVAQRRCGITFSVANPIPVVAQQQLRSLARLTAGARSFHHDDTVLKRFPGTSIAPNLSRSSGDSGGAMGWDRLVVTGGSALFTLVLARRLVQKATSESEAPAAAATRSAMASWPSPVQARAITSEAAESTCAPRHGHASSSSSPLAAHQSGSLSFSAQAATALLLAAGLLSVAAAAAARSFATALPTGVLVAAATMLSFLLGAVAASAATGASEPNKGKQDSLSQDGTLAAGATPPPPAPVRLSPDMAGTWVKVPHLSDSMDAACDVMHLNGIMRTAIRLVRGVEIHVIEPWEGGPGVFDMAVFSVFPWFKVRERYELNGTVSMWKRRDFRNGKHKGCVRVLPSGSLLLQLQWGEPYGGQGTDEFTLVGRDELHVVSTLIPADTPGKSVVYKIVYVRKQPA